MKVSVYFANFVLMDYGLGAVFGCPAHDQRDLDFAKNAALSAPSEAILEVIVHFKEPTGMTSLVL